MSDLNKLAARQEKLAYLNSLAYAVKLEKRGAKFYLSIPELCLIAISENLDAAYKDLNIQKERYFNAILDLGAEDEIALPIGRQRARQTKNALRIFIYKILILSFILGGGIAFGGAVLINKVSNIPFSNIAMKAAEGIVREVEKISNTSEDVKEIRIKKFRGLLEGARPYIDEYRKVISTPIDK